MEIIKYEENYVDNICLQDSNKNIVFNMDSNGDFNWIFNNKEVGSKDNTFIITKENFDAYEIFEFLFYDIENTNIFDTYFYEREPYLIGNDLLDIQNELYDKDNNTLTWYSDSGLSRKDKSNILKIKKEEDEFRIEFINKESLNEDNKLSIPIIISRRHSRFEPYNIPFMQTYLYLLGAENKDDINHQIHMEEYLYKIKKLK